jgi:hypothetical protein
MRQLSFFDNDTEQNAARPPAPTTYNIPAMRAWLLSWGERHNYPALSFSLTDTLVGHIWPGQADWYQNTQLENHNHNLKYPAQWLVQAIEYVKRFDCRDKE